MNEIFGYCGWDFGGVRNNEFQKGEHVRIGRQRSKCPEFIIIPPYAIFVKSFFAQISLSKILKFCAF